MKICITTKGSQLESPIDPVFGRAQNFLFVDSETRDISCVTNVPGAHGAGVQAAQLMVENGAMVVLTGSVGPNAFQGLNAAGIEICIGAKGTAQDALAAYEAGTLQSPTGPTSQGHGGGGRR